jgi:hypothetical protein
VNPIEFQPKWIGVELKERSAAQEHFLDLCRVLGHQTPAEMDREGTTFTFERGAAKSIGGQGWADVWYRGHFAWEYKGPHKDLVKAYDQLLRYKDDLENPPLLIVSDLNRIEIHTNFTGTVKNVHAMDLHTFAEPANLAILRQAFYEPDRLRPGITVAGVTEEAARQFGAIAQGMHARGKIRTGQHTIWCSCCFASLLRMCGCCRMAFSRRWSRPASAVPHSSTATPPSCSPP